MPCLCCSSQIKCWPFQLLLVCLVWGKSKSSCLRQHHPFPPIPTLTLTHPLPLLNPRSPRTVPQCPKLVSLWGETRGPKPLWHFNKRSLSPQHMTTTKLESFSSLVAVFAINWSMVVSLWLWILHILHPCQNSFF